MSAFVITPEVDFSAMFPVQVLSDELTVLEMGIAIGIAVAIGILFHSADLAVLVVDPAIRRAGRVGRLLTSDRPAIFIKHPQGRFTRAVGVLTLARDFSIGVEVQPGIDLTVIFA